MSAESASLPSMFIWGQIVGAPAIGFTIVAHSQNIDAARAESLRHRVMSLLTLPVHKTIGQAFGVNLEDNTVYFVNYEQSVKPQVGRGEFTQEYHVVWDMKAFASQHYRFWSVATPREQLYTAVEEVILVEHLRADIPDDASLLCNALQADGALILGVLNSILGQNNTVRIATTGSTTRDAALMQAVHLLVPPPLRPQVTFATNVTAARSTPFLVSFCDAPDILQAGVAFQPEQLNGYRVPGYASLIHLYLETHPDRTGAARLVEAFSDLQYDREVSCENLGNDLAVGLWDRIAIDLVSKLWNSLGRLDPDVLLLALKSRQDQSAGRQAILERVVAWLGDYAAEGHSLTTYIEHLVDALQRSQQTTKLALHVLPLRWREQTDLILEVCDALVRSPDGSRRELWTSFILPLLQATRFARDEHAARAETWLVSDTIRLDQFLEICDVNKPRNLYELVNRLTQQGHIPNSAALLELSERHPSLLELRETVKFLEQNDSQKVATGLAAVSHTSPHAYEGLVVLLVELLLHKPLSGHLPRLVGILRSAIQLTGLPALGRESARQALLLFRAVSTQLAAIEITRSLLDLGQQLGMDPKDILATLSRSAQIRYYVHMCTHAPDCMDNRLKYFDVIANLLMDPDISLVSLSREELLILILMYEKYNEEPAVGRLDEELQRRESVEQVPTHSQITRVDDLRQATSLLPCVCCGAEFQEQDEYVLCPKCKRPYHVKCWIKVGQMCIKRSCRWQFADLWKRIALKRPRRQRSKSSPDRGK